MSAKDASISRSRKTSAGSQLNGGHSPTTRRTSGDVALMPLVYRRERSQNAIQSRNRPVAVRPAIAVQATRIASAWGVWTSRPTPTMNIELRISYSNLIVSDCVIDQMSVFMYGME